MIYYYLIILFILGTFVGSFINMAVYRYHEGQNFFGRSFCDHCKKPLKAFNLIPIFSYLFQKGKSSCCGKPLDKLSPTVEFITGLTFATVFYKISGYPDIQTRLLDGQVSGYLFFVYLLLTLFLASILIFSFKYDLKYMEIPLKPILMGYIVFLLTVVVRFFQYKNYLLAELENNPLGEYLVQTDFILNRMTFFIQDYLPVIYFAVFVFIFFFALFYFTKGRGMGFGDVYTAPLLTLIAGFPEGVVFLFSSFILGALYGIFTIFLNKNTLKSQVPFGPFLILGLAVSLLFGKNIVKFYLGI